MYLKIEKWRNLFKMFDLDHNKVFNKDDVIIQWNVLKNIYDMEGFEAERVKEQLFMIWNCLLHSFENGLSIEDFVATFAEAKDLTVEKIHQCLAFYIDVFDRNKDGYISALEFDVHYKSLNLGHEILEHNRFETICTEPVQRCSIDKFFDAWTEVLIGDDRYKYELIKNDYKTAGMPLDKLVE